ncbi:MAG: hypothetical protein PHO63_05865 [Bacilli bacterium]|nr:hypothetical protein [Bacilli bacterium]
MNGEGSLNIDKLMKMLKDYADERIKSSIGDKDKKYELLPVIDIKNDSFSPLDKDKSESKIISLINSYIIFEFWDKKEHTIQHILGKLLKYKDSYLIIKPYNYINEPDFFKEFEKVHIDKIRGIEKYEECNPSLKFKDEFKDTICEITDRDNKTITVLVNDFDNFEIEFQFKYKDENGERIGAGSYPICLIKDIKLL